MGILSSSEISDRLRLDVDNPKSLVITPLLSKKDALSADSVDLRLGTYFLLPSGATTALYCA